MKPCECGSYAINPRHHGREEGKLLDLCDVCYWRTIAQEKTHPPQDVEEFIACGCGDLFPPNSRGEAFIDIFGECENCHYMNDSCSDIEGFIIDKSDVLFGDDGSEHEIIYLSDFRSLMTGHVRVPVELIENTLAAVREEFNKAYNEAYPVCCGRAGQECCGSPEPEWPEHAQATMSNLGPVEHALAALLNASKEK